MKVILSFFCGSVTAVGCVYFFGSSNPGVDYQINISKKGTSLYDGSRNVAFIPAGNITQLDSILIDDNQ